MKELDKINSALKKQGFEPMENEKLELLSAELDKIHARKDFWRSDGGKEVVNVYKLNCEMALSKLIRFAKDRPSIDEMMSCVIQYATNIEQIAQLTDITEQKAIEDQIDETLKVLYDIR